MEQLLKYFPDLSSLQIERFRALEPLYRDWNQKINVVSRKDIDSLYLRHVLHSLALIPFMRSHSLAPSTVLDLGCGGGFPGIPLAIMLPDVKFTLCDSIAKKIRVVEAVASSLGLENVEAVWGRAESLTGTYDLVVSRAVASLGDLLPWIKGRSRDGLLCLKGGDLEEEICCAAAKMRMDRGRFLVEPVGQWFEEDEFVDKKVVFVRR